MDGLISVIIPVFNREKYLKECIDSVMAQSYKDFEIIIVDDGSTDSSLELSLALAEKDQRIKVFSSQHGGVSAARNIAIEKSCGEWLFFLDSDDIIHPLLFETFASAMKESNAEIAGTGVINFPEKYWEKVYEIIGNETKGETRYLPHKDALHSAMTGNSPIGIIGGVMMRRDLIGDTLFKTDLFIGEDFFFIYENLIKGASAVFLEQRWYYCRHHAENTSWDFGYTGFMKRLYRRELVWKSELSFGRTEYANYQKVQVLDIFMRLLPHNKDNKAQVKKMCAEMKRYQRELFEGYSYKTRFCFLACVYFPKSYRLIIKIKEIRKKLLRR